MRNSRKMDHVHQAVMLGLSGNNGYSDIRLVHDSLPETSLDSISLRTRIGELTLSSPILINAMTGGAQETETINRSLAMVAKRRGLAMAVGSQMAAIKNREVESSYRVVREVYPDGVIFANLGSEATPSQAAKAVEMIDAQALQIHLNVMQELIMPEGDRDFRGATERIRAIVEEIDVPIIVKEVGFGMTSECAERLKDLGVSVIDAGGRGGTNFAAIENSRRADPIDLLNNWGVETSIAQLEVLKHFPAGRVIASGGIANSLDACKALCLGASAVGVAGAFLRVLQTEGIDALEEEVIQMEQGMIRMMTALGASTISDLWDVPLVITGQTAEWAKARGTDTDSFARRNRKNKV